jgi:hypothetical protein
MFSVTNCNGGSPSMTQDFLTFVLMDVPNANVTPNTKWACHVGFDNLG